MINYMCVMFNAILNTGIDIIQWCEAINSSLHQKCVQSVKYSRRCLNNRLVAWAELNRILGEPECACRKD